MQTAWFVIIAFMIAMYVVLDGFDFGAGIAHLFVAKTDEERRTVFAAIGPLWDGNEVWLIAGGGVLVFAFPRVYAVAFSGFYLPLMIVLWLLVLRGISIEFRSRQHNPLWRTFWDAVFAFSSTLVALVLGVALANVVRGVPIDASGFFRGSLFTHFRTHGHAGAFDWYTVLMGIFSLVVLAAHGALFLQWKTTGPVHARATRLAYGCWIAVVLFGIAATAATMVVQPVVPARLLARPGTWVLPLGALASMMVVFVALVGRRERTAFLASVAFIVSLLGATAAALYPDILRSTLGEQYHLTVFNASAGPSGLRIGLWWWIPAIVLVIGYFAYLFRMFRGKVSGGYGEH